MNYLLDTCVISELVSKQPDDQRQSGQAIDAAHAAALARQSLHPSDNLTLSLPNSSAIMRPAQHVGLPCEPSRAEGSTHG